MVVPRCTAVRSAAAVACTAGNAPVEETVKRWMWFVLVMNDALHARETCPCAEVERLGDIKERRYGGEI